MHQRIKTRSKNVNILYEKPKLISRKTHAILFWYIPYEDSVHLDALAVQVLSVFQKSLLIFLLISRKQSK